MLLDGDLVFSNTFYDFLRTSEEKMNRKMSQRLDQAIRKRGNQIGQQTYEKMFNLISNQRAAD